MEEDEEELELVTEYYPFVLGDNLLHYGIGWLRKNDIEEDKILCTNAVITREGLK